MAKCFISEKETNDKTKGVPVHRDHREEFREYYKEHGHPRYSNYVNIEKLKAAIEESKQNEEIVVKKKDLEKVDVEG